MQLRVPPAYFSRDIHLFDHFTSMRDLTRLFTSVPLQFALRPSFPCMRLVASSRESNNNS